MFGALVKKQFLELNRAYFQNQKTGKNRSKAGTVGYVILWVFLFLLIALISLLIAFTLGEPMLKAGLDWLYFAFMGLLTVLMGVLGSVFNTYASLYLSKENEQLLAMPIPPVQLLLSRMIGVFAMSFLYSGIIWIPTMIRYWLKGIPGFSGILNPILLFFVLGIFVATLTCLFGWIIAMVARKTRSKTFVSVILSVLFIGGFYFLNIRFMSVFEQIGAHLEDFVTAANRWLYPFVLMGKGAAGAPGSMLFFTGGVLVLFGLCMWIMSKNYYKIMMTAAATRKKTAAVEKNKAVGIKTALFKRELKHFTGSATYILNCGLGLILLPAAAVFGAFQSDKIMAWIQTKVSISADFTAMIPIFLLCIVCALISMNVISTPSVSLEGKNLWLIRSLPVKTLDILKAKEGLHVALNSLSAIVSIVIFGIACQLNVRFILADCVGACLFAWLSADFGLFLGLKKPDLSWSSESIPIKQSLSVFAALFGGWLFCGVILVLGFVLSLLLSPLASFGCIIGIFILLRFFLYHWIKTKGVRILEAL